MCAWAELNFTTPCSRIEVMEQPTWAKSNIKIAQEWCTTPRCKENEPKTIADVIDESKENFVTHNAFKNRFPQSKLTFIDLLSIKTAMPRVWVRLLKINIGAQARPGLPRDCIKLSRWAYNALQRKQKEGG